MDPEVSPSLNRQTGLCRWRSGRLDQEHWSCAACSALSHSLFLQVALHCCSKLAKLTKGNPSLMRNTHTICSWSCQLHIQCRSAIGLPGSLTSVIRANPL